jgi:6-pyruvoyltetrahydropterin/6-carboxytetrahydropterin synthase
MEIYCKHKFKATHHLSLLYDSPCNQPHEHNWLIEVWVKGEPEQGIIVDFNKLKETLASYENKDLNVTIANPTAENFALEIQSRIDQAISKKARVRVWETDDCYAETD